MAIDINVLKANESILEFANSIGFELKPYYQGAITHCPRCKDTGNKMHLYLYSNSNRFHCKKCNSKGSMIDLLMLSSRCSQNEAIQRLKCQYQWKYSNLSKQPLKSDIWKSKINESPEQQSGQDYLEIYSAFFELLTITKKGKRYLNFERAISDDTIDKFNIKSIDNPVKIYNRLKSLFSEDILIKSGMMYWNKKNKLQNAFFLPCIVFPHIENGKLVYLSTRNIMGNPKSFKLPGKSRLFIGNTNHNSIMIFEGIINALSYYELIGNDNIIAIGGLLTNGQYRELVSRYPDKRLILAFDSDSAGKQATSKLIGAEYLKWDNFSRKFKSFEQTPVHEDTGKQWDCNDFLIYFRDTFEERAGIMEFDGCLSRAEAEHQALNCIIN